MSVFSSVGIIIIAMLIMASLQLVPGVFALFHHYASGKYSKKRTSRLSLFFILGAEVISACLFLFSFYIAYFFFLGKPRPEHSVFAWFGIGVLIALSIASFFFYFRRGKGTQLFIARSFAKALNESAKSAKTRSDAFALGAISSTCEILFTLPLYIITAIEIIELSSENFTSDILTIIYILTSAIPLFITYYLFHSGRNLADIERTRVKDKTFTRLLMGFSYLIIAILIIHFKINNW